MLSEQRWLELNDCSDERHFINAFETYVITDEDRETMRKYDLSYDKISHGRYDSEVLGDVVNKLCVAWNQRMGFEFWNTTKVDWRSALADVGIDIDKVYFAKD